MEELSKKIDKRMSRTVDLRNETTDKAMRDYYLGKIVAFAEVQGFIETSKGEKK